MIDHWELLDLLKAVMGVVAGMILGLEREMKDKVAGLKTITIICLGATLFGILSYKVGAPDNPTHIAAYVVTGVGFLGAGAIFKDGFSISGLTTAGIIWLAAAVGLAIGFSEFYLAATFLAATMLIIIITPFINRVFRSKKVTRHLEITLDREDIHLKEELLLTLGHIVLLAEEKKIIVKEDSAVISLELVMNEKKVKEVEDFLLSAKSIREFCFS